MIFSWVDYDFVLHREIEEWVACPEMKKFVCDTSWFNEWNYYVNSPEYKAGENAFCKVVSLNGEIISSMILLCDSRFPVAINPIIIKPCMQNRGFGERIIKELIANLDTLLPEHSNEIEVGIDAENKASIRLFEKCNFVLNRVHPDGDFLFFVYHL